MPQNLFVLSTPSQAFFLNQTPHLIVDAILILTVKDDLQAARIMKYLNNHKWDAIFTIYLPKGEKLFEYLKILYFKFWLISFRLRFTTFKRVFIGSYINPYHISIFGAFEKYAKIFLLYEGMQTISVSQNRKLGKKGPKTFPAIFKRIGLKNPKIENLNYVGPLTVEVSTNDCYIKFNNVVSYPHPILKKDVVYFVGQPLIGLGIVTKEFFLSKLEEVRKEFINSKIIYIPHPREKEKDLKEVKKKFEIKRFSEIFEEEFISSEEFAGTVISFYSSTIMNLCYLQAKIDLRVIYIPFDHFLRKDSWESVSLGYDFMRKIEYPYLSFFEKS